VDAIKARATGRVRVESMFFSSRVADGTQREGKLPDFAKI
jgi:hypothetical protein